MSEETALTIQDTGLASLDNLAIQAEDIEIQRLNVVQKSSDIGASTGSLVLDKKHILLEPEQVGKAIVVSVMKGWREDVPYESEAISRVATTLERKEQLAAESDYPLLEFADIVLLIEQPEGSEDDDAYALPIGDKNYALGKLYVAKHGYRQTFKRLATFLFTNRSTPIQSIYWNLQTQSMEKGKYSWYIPSLANTNSKTPEAVTEFLKTFGA